MPSMIPDQATGSGLVARGRFYTQVNATTANIKGSAGRLVRIIVVAGTGAVTAYDGPNGTGNVLWTKAAVTAGDIYDIDMPTTAQLSVTAAAATTVNVVWS